MPLGGWIKIEVAPHSAVVYLREIAAAKAVPMEEAGEESPGFRTVWPAA
jgi:hypothetical protein